VHCATQDPDSPQLCAHEKLLELQFAMHSAEVCAWASRNLSSNGVELLETTPDQSMKSAIKYLMPFLPKYPSRGISTNVAHQRGNQMDALAAARTPILAFVSIFYAVRPAMAAYNPLDLFWAGPISPHAAQTPVERFAA
jgi:hypothetical protein